MSSAAPSKEFHADAKRMSRDFKHRSFIGTALRNYEITRQGVKDKFQDWESARQQAAEIKWETINHLDQYLQQFVATTAARGTQVFWAFEGEDACRYIEDVCRRVGAKRIIKSKSMTTEEIHLNAALEKSGYEVVESDLGEYIVQLRKEDPYHIIFPAMHLTRGEISETFTKELGTAPTNSPEDLTMIARDILRHKYLQADVGISGANFAIAETGMISITENEGNARLTTALPRIHIAILGIEKLLPQMADLALFLPMLATMGTGQALTCYNTLIGGPRQEGESDGPEEFHIVLLDNGRTRLLADPEQRDALQCIRCGACLNACPIFKNIGGHSYSTTYQGPIGSVITPHLRGLKKWNHLSFASSLCGACTEVCPVKIDLHHHLLQNRRNAALAPSFGKERRLFRAFAFLMTHPRLYRLATRMTPLLMKLHRLVQGKPSLDPVYGWTQSRDLPTPPSQTFKDYWAGRQKKGKTP